MSPSPSSSSPFLSRLRSAASSLVSRQYSTSKGGKRTGGRRGGGSSSEPRPSTPGFVDPSTWRVLDSRAFGINQDGIHKDALAVIKKLRQKGFEAYLVGGCVRDLLLKRVPKDFDVITTASLQQLKKNVFRRCMIVGKRFPICLLRMRDSVIEVSSFQTVGNRMNKTEKGECLEELNGYDDRDILRWKDSMRRDFTINGLFFNPMNYRIYDYVKGVKDMRKNKVSTVIPAHISFREDPARILRGLRIAARLGFQFSSETSSAIRDLSSSIINIDKTRLMLEMNYMLSYGAAEPSVRLLRVYGLLDILLPFQAAYLSDQMKNRARYEDLMLMRLLGNLDRLFSADQPCHCSLWLALLVFHTTLVISPQDTLVIRAFAALLYFGSWESATEFLNKEEEDGAQVSFVPETLGPSQTKLDDLMEQASHLASLVNASVHTLTSSDALEQSLARFSEPPQFSGVVLASNNYRNRLLKIFGDLNSDLTSHDERRWLHKINYWSLKDGNPSEVRFVLGKVIMDTMGDKSPSESAEEETLLLGGSCPVESSSRPPLSALFQSL